MKEQFRAVYDQRWRASYNTADSDILVFQNPTRQVEFFYLMYNRIISELIENNLGNCTEKLLMELGCGRSTSSIFQAITLGIDVLPTDYSPEALRVAQANLDKYGINATPKIENLLDLSQQAGTIDVIISLGVMEHIEDTKTAYEEMLRVLKPGGIMISMNVPDKPDNIQRIANPINKFLVGLKNLFGKPEAKPWLDKSTHSKTAGVYRSFLNGAQFGTIVSDVGFQNVSVLEVNPFPTFDPVPSWIDYILVKTYQLILFCRMFWFRKRNPFLCSDNNSRAHFIYGQKSGEMP